VNEINRVVPQLIRNGKLIRPGIGVSLADARLVKRLGIDGVLVLGVENGGPAHRAGLRPTKQYGSEVVLGDVITGIGGNRFVPMMIFVLNWNDLQLGIKLL